MNIWKNFFDQLQTPRLGRLLHLLPADIQSHNEGIQRKNEYKNGESTDGC
jgi:hypothetical protein